MPYIVSDHFTVNAHHYVNHRLNMHLLLAHFLIISFPQKITFIVCITEYTIILLLCSEWNARLRSKRRQTEFMGSEFHAYYWMVLVKEEEAITLCINMCT